MGLSIKILVSYIDENIRMNTMSLYESSDSPGDIFLKNLCENRFESKILEETGLERLAYLIVRGGWSDNISVEIDKWGELALCYIENVIKTDLKQLDKDIDYNEHKAKLILKSLPPYESTTVSNQSVLRDIIENDDSSISKNTLIKYLNAFNRMFLFNIIDFYLA